MGLERIACVMQGAHDNYEIDVFKHLLAAVSELTHCDDFSNKSMRAIADHIRSCAFLIVDGVVPSNEGRGYVLRRILRRAIRHGYKLGVDEIFFYKLVESLVLVMGKAFPNLEAKQQFIENCLKQEELLFAETLGKGMKILEMQLRRLTTDVIPGSVAFLLYDTYGFPLDLTADIARERNLELDVKGFNQAMQQQRKLSQSANRFKLDEIKQLHIAIETEFTGYECTNGKANIKSIIGYDNRPVAQIALVLDSSPFYPEGGGQVGDKGVISSVDSEFLVEDTQKQGGAILHFGRVVRGRFCVDQEVLCEVDMSRQAVRCNHSATHLLHQALRHILGAHVVQKGSLVDVDHLRFDFSHPEAIAANELEAIEIMVNTAIRNNVPLTTEINTLDEARNAGAMALFGEKYDTKVRVVTMGNFSKEVCGGTHVSATGDIGCFKILSESACAQGVRRIDAVTGRRAMDFMREEINRLGLACSTLNTSSSKLNERVFNLLDENKLLARECAQLKRNLASYQGDSLLSNVVKIGDYNVLSGMLENADRDTLRDTMDRFKDSLGNAVVLLATIDSATGKVVLVCGVSPSVQSVLKAPEVLKYVCSQIGGKGGGRPDFAQGGADSSEGLESALNSVESWVKGKV